MSKINRIAITGTIGSGKSTVTNYIIELGYHVFDCDAYNAELLNNKAYELLFNDFSSCFIDRQLNKNKLANIVFNDEIKRKQLENIMHPLILEKILSINEYPLFCEVPLLFESNWQDYFDLSILVVTNDNLVFNRLLDRGVSIRDAKARIKAQMPISEKIKKADRIIYNNGSLSYLYNEIDILLKQLC